MDMSCGPIRIEVVEPLKSVRLIVEDHEGISANLLFTGRSEPFQEPRFTRRTGTRMFMDLTRFTVNCHVTGWIEVDGVRETYTSGYGTRDRSWGVRSIGAADPQPVVPQVFPQFYWLWSPTNFAEQALYAHVNEDQAGVPWNRRASLMADGGGQHDAVHLHDEKFSINWGTGTRHATSARLDMKDDAGRPVSVTWQPIGTFLMKGIGYGHPQWTHGGWKGEYAVEREALFPDQIDPLDMSHLHIQAIATARMTDGDGHVSEGIGLVEQFVIGPHDASGFVALNDGAG
jgi:hypothetical protein